MEDDAEGSGKRGNKRRRSDDDANKGDGGGDRDKSKMRRVEKQAHDRVVDRVRQIVEREFGRSLRQKEDEVERVEQRLLQVQKALHMVRYGAVANYYSGAAMPKQTRSQPEEVFVHPAVRPLLAGKRPPSTETTATNHTSQQQEKAPANKGATPVNKEREKESDRRMPSPETKPGYVPPNPSSDLPTVADPRGLHHKTKRRFIVGNVSKWIQCDQREDLSTHKWMMYVRGDRDAPDVSDVVSKVRFLIHPSYHPHDLVEVAQPPFHLTRRGWGEFPARVQIHFKEPRDKPVDVIHHLKLDKTYTGLQTLGAETTVDVWLHDLESLRAAARAREAADAAPSDAIIDKFEVKPEGLVIPHGDVSDVIDPSILSNGEPGDEVFARTAVAIKKEPLPQEEGREPAVPLVQAPCQGRAIPLNGNVAGVNGNGDVQVPQDVKPTYIRCTDKRGEKYYLPVAFLSKGQEKVLSKVVAGGKMPGIGSAATAVGPLKPRQQQQLSGSPRRNALLLQQQSPIRVKTEPGTEPNKVVVAQANGVSLVKSESAAAGARQQRALGVSLLRPGVRSGGVSLLKKNSSSPTPPSATTVVTLTNGSTHHHVLTTTPPPSPLTELERAVPAVSLEQWAAVLGKRDGEEDGQADVEERMARRAPHILKRYLEHHRFLASRLLLRLDARSFDAGAEGAVFYVARYLPLVTPAAREPSYRALHPYAAASQAAFLGWNVGKQLAAEWQRAKTVSRILHTFKPSLSVTAKEAFDLLRRHGYSFSHIVATKPADIVREADKPAVVPSVSDLLDFSAVDAALAAQAADMEEAARVDVVGEGGVDGGVDDGGGKGGEVRPEVKVELSQQTRKCLMLPEDSPGGLRFVREAAGEIGIRFAAQEIAPAVYYPADEKLIYRACKNMCELLLRKSFKARFDEGRAAPEEVTASDVRKAIATNDAFSVFTLAGLGAEREDEAAGAAGGDVAKKK